MIWKVNYKFLMNRISNKKKELVRKNEIIRQLKADINSDDDCFKLNEFKNNDG